MDNKHLTKRAALRVEEVREALDENRDVWEELEGIAGINKRWLRAFVSGQLNQPPAIRFIAIERYLADCGKITKR